MSYIDDLKVAHAASLMVDVTLVNGQTFFAGVQELDEAFGTVTLYAPKALSASAAQRIALSAIVSVAVMQIEMAATQRNRLIRRRRRCARAATRVRSSQIL